MKSEKVETMEHGSSFLICCANHEEEICYHHAIIVRWTKRQGTTTSPIWFVTGVYVLVSLAVLKDGCETFGAFEPSRGFSVSLRWIREAPRPRGLGFRDSPKPKGYYACNEVLFPLYRI